METNGMVNKIKKCLSEICRQDIFGDENWTERLKKSLGQIGKDNEFKICAATKNKEYETEWLYDLVWYKEDDQGFLIEVPLVVESEWKKNLTKDVACYPDEYHVAAGNIYTNNKTYEKALIAARRMHFEKGHFLSIVL